MFDFKAIPAPRTSAKQNRTLSLFLQREGKDQHVPFGEGWAKKSFQQYRQSVVNVPAFLHVEYQKKGDAEENRAALKRDYAMHCDWLDL